MRPAFDPKAHDSRLIGPEEMELRWASDELRECRRLWDSSSSQAVRIGASLAYAKAIKVRGARRLSLVVDNELGG